MALIGGYLSSSGEEGEAAGLIHKIKAGEMFDKSEEAMLAKGASIGTDGLSSWHT